MFYWVLLCSPHGHLILIKNLAHVYVLNMILDLVEIMGGHADIPT